MAWIPNARSPAPFMIVASVRCLLPPRMNVLRDSIVRQCRPDGMLLPCTGGSMFGEVGISDHNLAMLIFPLSAAHNGSSTERQ